MNKANRLLNSLDSFVEKMANVNKPYKALQGTAEYKKFHTAFEEAIQQQAKWAADHIKFVTDVPGYLEQQMPKIGSLLDSDMVADYFKFCFEWGVKAQYQRWGIKKANHYSNFALRNKNYISKLNDDANYLLSTKSSIDPTTRDRIIKIIQDSKAQTDEEGNSVPMTNDDISAQISSEFDSISSVRADMIAITETAQAMGSGNFATLIENNIPQYSWVTAGPNPCIICDENADASPINVGDTFPSGDQHEPAHIRCECYTEADLSSIDLTSFNIWDGS